MSSRCDTHETWYHLALYRVYDPQKQVAKNTVNEPKEQQWSDLRQRNVVNAEAWMSLKVNSWPTVCILQVPNTISASANRAQSLASSLSSRTEAPQWSGKMKGMWVVRHVSLGEEPPLVQFIKIPLDSNDTRPMHNSCAVGTPITILRAARGQSQSIPAKA